MKTVGIVIAAVVVFIGAFFVAQYNGMQSAKVNAETMWAQAENQMQRRADLIPNLVNTAKGYATHEKAVFTEIANARSKVNNATTPVEKDAANTELSSALSRLMMVVENYPTLKADTHFKQLMDELAGSENRIAVARRDYVQAVQNYNLKVTTFPGTLFASMFGYQQMEQFKADETAKVAPKVEF